MIFRGSGLGLTEQSNFGNFYSDQTLPYNLSSFLFPYCTVESFDAGIIGFPYNWESMEFFGRTDVPEFQNRWRELSANTGMNRWQTQIGSW
jgi:hypothetical protein